MSQRTFMLQAGIGGDIHLPARWRKHTSHMLGFRVGFAYDPTPTRDWEIDGVEVTSGPRASMSGVYGQVILGRSSQRPVKKWHRCPANKEDQCPRHRKREQTHKRSMMES
jgi:hypothetical protein